MPLHALLLRHRTVAFWVAVAALFMKAMLPTGYMVGHGSGAAIITVSLCDSAIGESVSRQISIPLKDGSSDTGKQAKPDCPFASLSMASMGGVDAALLALALAFALALGFAPSRPAATGRIAFLRPPLRGPPSLA